MKTNTKKAYFKTVVSRLGVFFVLIAGVLVATTLTVLLLPRSGAYSVLPPVNPELYPFLVFGLTGTVICLFAIIVLGRKLLQIQNVIQNIVKTWCASLHKGMSALPPLPVKHAQNLADLSTELLTCLNEVVMKSKGDLDDLHQNLSRQHELSLFLLSHNMSLNRYLELSSLTLASLGIGIRVLNSQLDILYENEMFHRLSASTTSVIENLIQIAVRHVSSRQRDNLYVHRNNNIVLKIQVFPLKLPHTAADEKQGAAIVLEDITQQDLLKRQLIESERWSAMGEMVAQVSHEIRNPLNAINLNLEMVNEDLESIQAPKTTLRLIKETLRQTDRLRMLSDHYLKLHRQFDTRGAFDPHSVVKQMVTELEPLAIRRQVKLQTALSRVPCFIKGDEQALVAIAQNILQNAIENTNENNAVTIVTKVLPQQRFCLKVKDRGASIPIEHREQIFRPFFTTKKEGTGLGLAIAKQAAHHLLGKIRVLSGLTKRGNLFVFECPTVRGSRLTPNSGDKSFREQHRFSDQDPIGTQRHPEGG